MALLFRALPAANKKFRTPSLAVWTTGRGVRLGGCGRRRLGGCGRRRPGGCGRRGLGGCGSTSGGLPGKEWEALLPARRKARGGDIPLSRGAS